jgi:Tfp pilus assembly protein PilX
MLKKIIFWPKTTSILNNEEGVVIIAALMILVLLTIIGVASTNVSNTEVKIATHELIHQQNFYRAEGATMEAVVQMTPAGAPSIYWSTTDVERSEEMRLNNTFSDSDYWESGSNPTPEMSTSFPDTKIAGAYWGLLAGEPLEIGSTKRHRYAIFGHSAPRNRGAVTVEIGYIKAY